MNDGSTPKEHKNTIEEEEFLNRCGTMLIGLPADKAINRILGLLGRSHQADRAWVVSYNRDFTHFWNTHEWTRGETSQHVTDLQGVPVEMGAWLHETLLKNQSIFITDTGKMPRRARALQAEFQRQGIGSLLSVPVFYRGRMRFQIGYDAKSTELTWSDNEVALLRRVGRLFAIRLLCKTVPPSLFLDNETQNIAQINIQDRGVHQRSELEKITHITSDGDYSHIHFVNEEIISDTRSLRYWQSALSPRDFIRISRSTIINLNQVEKLDRRGGNWKIKLKRFDDLLTVGRSYRTELRHKLEA